MVDKIHTHVIHHEDQELEWKFDKGYSNYIGLCFALCSELFCEDDFARKRTVNITIYAVVEGKAKVISIVNDDSMMRMFASIVDTNDSIQLYVDFEEVDGTIELVGGNTNQGRNRAIIYKLEDVPDS